MPDTVTLTPRVVPGAPPPVAPSKSHKKKRKAGKPKEESDGGSHVAVPDSAAAALIDKAPEEGDVKEGIVAPQLVAQPSLPSEGLQTPLLDVKPSPVVEMLNKRLKANGKKITRIQGYQNEPPEKLNEDQRRLLKTLPVLEGISKELEEVKKAIETHETEVAQELAFQKILAARAEAERISEAVASEKAEHLEKTAQLLSFLRLPNMLTNRHPDAMALNLVEAESTAIFSIAEILCHEALRGKDEVISGIFTGEGEHLGTPYARIKEIQQQFLFPESRPEPAEIVQEEPVAEESSPSVTGVPHTIAVSGGIHFIMTDELAEAETEAAVEPLGEGVDWVDVKGPTETEQHAQLEITETIVEAEVNGHAVVEESVTVATTTEVPAASQLNWADEDQGDLPSLANLQAHYGTSGEASPAPEAETPLPEAASAPPANGSGNDAVVDEDGFTQLRNRGRGRGHRGGERGGYRGGYRGEHGDRSAFRGGERGGYRGERGGFRGEHGERGGFRGEHGERGGFRGEHGERGGRGGYRGGRGGDRGGFRGRSDGEWRGGRGGRGRGRGGFQDGGSTAPSPAT